MDTADARTAAYAGHAGQACRGDLGIGRWRKSIGFGVAIDKQRNRVRLKRWAQYPRVRRLFLASASFLPSKSAVSIVLIFWTGVTVRLRRVAAEAVLEITDTGVGVAAGCPVASAGIPGFALHGVAPIFESRLWTSRRNPS
jgi:hypothetical protein